jgi:hypothetical protein
MTTPDSNASEVTLTGLPRCKSESLFTRTVRCTREVGHKGHHAYDIWRWPQTHGKDFER